MHTTTRRGFLAQAALAAAAGPLALTRSASAISPIGRTRPSHLKLSLAGYSYNQLLRDKKLDLFDFVNLAADYAIDAVEPTSYYFPPNVTTEYLHRLKQHAFMLGLDISGTAVGNNFCLPPGPAFDKQLEQMRAWIDRAADLDAPVIRIFAGNTPRGESEDKAIEWAINGIKASLPYAAEKGVTLALENHGGVTEALPQMMKIIKAVDAPNFGVNLDTGNFRTEDPYADMEALAPYAVNVQVKTEFQRKGQSKKEDADLAREIKILRDARYSGYVVLEYEGAENPMTGVPKALKTLRELIS
jgi:sugar phosphate isomerase/epimerase